MEEINAAMIGGLVTLDAGGEYLNPRAYTDRAVGVPGIGGVGLAYTKRHQTLTVVTPFAGLPADQAGFRAGDRIRETDARPAEGLSLGEVIRLMPGSPGSTVRLTVARDGWPEPRQIELARVRIPPMVVLMNHESGGASEVVAAALRDWGRATLVGERSPGQSLLQTYFPLADGSALRLTIARWFTSKGQRVVNGVGLTPDVEVIADTDIAPLSADPAKDNQLRRALEVLATQR